MDGGGGTPQTLLTGAKKSHLGVPDQLHLPMGFQNFVINKIRPLKKMRGIERGER